MDNLKTEISYMELVASWAPLMDVSLALDKMHCDDGTLGYIDDKVKSALEPLRECIKRIEKENPDDFG